MSNETTTRSSIPEHLACPDAWKYTEAWQERYERKHGLDYLSSVCKHSGAGFSIMYFICRYGELALTKVKTQNLFIKRISSGKVDPRTISDRDIDWQSGATWEKLDYKWDELFEIYNAKMAPPDILNILNEVRAFMLAGESHCRSLLQYLTDARVALKHQDEIDDEAALIHEPLQKRPDKWELIDSQNSRVTDGFVYLLSNELMPGVYKIGFTAGNPDKRAREVSARYQLPRPFEVIEFWQTKYPYIVEQRIHKALAEYMKAGEFFEVDLGIAIETIEDHLQY
jgi:hypothetical protein